MGSKREKYPEKCPWDLGPNQHLAKEENWTLSQEKQMCALAKINYIIIIFI